MNEPRQLTLVGKVNKTHGVDGEMSVSFFEPAIADAIEEDTCIFFNIDGIMVPFFVDSVRPRSSEALLIHLDGEDSQQAASAFVGMDVYMEADSIPTYVDDPDGLYAAQLIGYKAYTNDGQEIGEVVDVDDNTDNPLFVIDSGDRQIYVPIVDEFIDGIDQDARTITFDLPEGLLDL